MAGPVAARGLLGTSARATLRPYQPTIRDNAAAWLLDHLGNGPVAQRMVEGLMGSTGTGQTKPSVVDFIPGVGQALQSQEAGRQIGAGHPVAGLANLALTAIPVPMAAKAARGMMGATARTVLGDSARAAEAAAPAVTEAAQQAAPPIIAYHGSPHTFDAFDLSKVGTGEGAQAYGHGLYFAESPQVADIYRRSLAGPQQYLPKDPTSIAARKVAAHMSDGKDFGTAVDDARWYLERQRDDTKDLLSWYKGPETEGTKQQLAEAQLGLSQLDNLTPDHFDTRQPGASYQVGINAHPDHFLDWDAPLSEQHPKVQAALNDAGVGRLRFGSDEGHQASSYSTLHPIIGPRGDQAAVVGEMDGRFNLYQDGLDKGEFPSKEAALAHVEANYGPIPGSAAYRGLINSKGDAGAAARALADAGIPGIKYLDQGSRASGDGTRNFVVFDPKNVDILKRYGIAASVLGAGGAGAAAADNSAGSAPQT